MHNTVAEDELRLIWKELSSAQENYLYFRYLRDFEPADEMDDEGKVSDFINIAKRVEDQDLLLFFETVKRVGSTRERLRAIGEGYLISSSRNHAKNFHVALGQYKHPMTTRMITDYVENFTTLPQNPASTLDALVTAGFAKSKKEEGHEKVYWLTDSGKDQRKFILENYRTSQNVKNEKQKD